MEGASGSVYGNWLAEGTQGIWGYDPVVTEFKYEYF